MIMTTAIENNQKTYDMPDMRWLAPLVVEAFCLRSRISGKNGELLQAELIKDYEHIIEYIAKRLMALPLYAMKIAKEVATESIWFDIADAVAAHYETSL